MSQDSQKTADNKTMQGILWMVITTIIFAFMTAIVRHLGSDVPATEAAFIRYLIGLILVTPIIFKGWTGLPDKTSLTLFAGRGLVHSTAVILWFYAMARIPMAEVTAIGYLAPIFVAIGAALFLGERLHFRRVMSIGVGILGAFIILRPGFADINSGQLAQLCAAPLFAVSWIFAKKLTGRENSAMIVWMLHLTCTIALIPGAILQWRPPTMEEIGWLALTALVATLGHFAMTKAFAAAPITLTQPIAFLQLIWASLLGMLIFGEAVDPFVIGGGALVVAAASYISHRELVASRAGAR
jgi:drug/metabolite transporter (DMT)-like permease